MASSAVGTRVSRPSWAPSTRCSAVSSTARTCQAGAPHRASRAETSQRPSIFRCEISVSGRAPGRAAGGVSRISRYLARGRTSATVQPIRSAVAWRGTRRSACVRGRPSSTGRIRCATRTRESPSGTGRHRLRPR
ncbi:hypothetical protein GY12_09055 [Micrococcus luteus]|nr:hypothetical protein GY12_09055 [Micrococcus luteus]